MLRFISIIFFLFATGSCKSKDPREAREDAELDRTALDAEHVPSPKGSTTTPSTGIHWLTSEDEAIARATKLARPLLIDFSAKWCAPCEKMEDETFADPRVVRLIGEGFVALRIDATDMNDDIEKLMARHKVKQLPVILIQSPEAELVARWDDFVPADELLAELSKHAR